MPGLNSTETATTKPVRGSIRGNADKAVAELRSLRRNGPWTIAAISPEGGPPVVRSFKGAIEVSRMRAWIHERNGVVNLYWTVNPTRRRMTTKPRKVDIGRFDYAHVEADPIDGESAAAAKKRHRKAIKSGKVPRPWKIYSSGNGIVALWKIKAPVLLTDEDRVASVEAFNVGLKLALGGKAAGYDDCQNIDRLLRLPHTVNLPDARKIAKGRAIELAGDVENNSDGVYELADLPSAAGATAPPSMPLTVGRAVSVEDLDDLPISDRIKEIIIHGRIGGETKPKDNSNSAWRYEAICYMLRRGVAAELIAGILIDPTYAISERGLAKGDSNAAEKYARKEIGRAQADVARRKAAELQADFPDDAPSIVPNVNKGAGEEFDEWAETPDGSRANPLTAITLSQIRSMPPVQYLVEGWIADNSLFVLFGKYNAGKTFFAVSVGCAIATGRKIFERKVKHGRVLYIVGEGGAKQFGNRVEAWIKATADGDKRLHTTLTAEIESQFHMLPVAIHVDVHAQVQAFLKANPGEWSLIVIDTLMRNFGGNVNEQADMAKFVHGCDLIRGVTKAAVMALHHPGNAIKDRAMGSVNLPAATDGIGELRAFGDGSKKQFEIKKLRDGAVHEQKVLDLVIETVVLSPAALDFDDERDEHTPAVVSGVMRYVGTINKPQANILDPQDGWLETIHSLKPRKNQDLCAPWEVSKQMVSRRIAQLREAGMIAPIGFKLASKGLARLAELRSQPDGDDMEFG